MSQTEWLTVASVVIPLAVVGLLMIFGWRALRRRQSDVAGLAPVPSDAGATTFTEDLRYVATTRADAPLERIAVKGLGFRARAVLTVSTAGIRLDLAGGEPGFIPTAALEGVGRATWTIDRAISKDGLVFVRWQRDDRALDSYFRSTDPAALVDVIEKLIPSKSEATA